MSTSSHFLQPKHAAEYITETGLMASAKSLAKLRSVGGGPRFRRFGRRVVYERLAIDQWIEERLTRECANTSDT